MPDRTGCLRSFRSPASAKYVYDRYSVLEDVNGAASVEGKKNNGVFNPCRLSLANTEIKRIASMVGETTEVDIRHVPGQSMIVDEHLKLFEIIYDFCCRQV